MRNSISASYDDGKIGGSLGTNFWRGSSGMAVFNQRTTIAGFRSGDFSFGYENDGSPFSYAGKLLSNNTDIYRTAAVNIGIEKFALQTNMFIGRSGNDNNCSDCVNYNSGRQKKGVSLGIWDNPGANKYRLGSLTIGYKSMFSISNV